MGCTALSKGRSIDCRNSAGGVKAIYIGAFDDTTLSITSQEVTDIDMTSSLYKYEVKRGTANYVDTINGSTDAGTIFYTPTCALKLHKLTKEDQNEIKLLAAQRLIIFVELNQTLAVDGHNVIVCLGAVNGMELNGGTGGSGTALGDMSGYDLAFDGQEPYPVSMVADYTTTPFDNSAFTVTVA